MEAVAPALMSGLAELLLRRPPSLRELVTLVGYADDYAWFVRGWCAASFPRRRRRRFRPPTYARGWNASPISSGSGTSPSTRRSSSSSGRREDEPPWSWLRRGIPFDLMGFGYDGLHEMWDGYREGLSAMALLVKPPDVYYDGPDGLRVAWLESAAERIPQETLLRVPEGGIPLDDLTGALKGTRFEGAAQACSWVLAETGNFFLDHTYDDGSYDGFADPWEDDIIAEGTEEWRKASALMDSVSKLTDWLEEDLPGRFAEMLDFTLERLPDQEKEENEHDQ